MKLFDKRFSVINGFLILLIFLVINGLVIRRQFGLQVQNHAWVAHTQQVLLELSDTESLLKDAEAGQQGYLYTGEVKYLAPYNTSVTQVEAHLQKLFALTADNPRQQVRIPRLRSLARQNLKELAATISLYRSGSPDAARAMVLSDAGLRTMDNIRALVHETQQEEISLAAARIEAYRASVQVTIACSCIASLLAALGLILLAYYILREMNLRERYATDIKQRGEWFRVTLTSIGDAVIATDQQGWVTFVNPVAEKLTGMSSAQAKGKAIDLVFPIFNEVTLQSVDSPVKKVMELGRVVGMANHSVLQRTDGTLIPIEDSAAPILDDKGKVVGVVLVFRDATYERKSQEILRRTEKLAAAARLAATVAHEINNPLEAVGNLIYLAKARTGVPADVVDDLKLAEHELERVSHITRQTLGFYRESVAADALDVPGLVDSVLKLYSNKFKSKDIKVERALGECPPVWGWPGELKQLISNLVSNAADAVCVDGALKVSVSCVDSHAGKVVQLRVEDDGPGIAPEYMDRIFEPFFTTKKDVGTGLGLWVAKEIVERHDGTIQVQSHCEGGVRGTAFTVILPCFVDVRSSAAHSG